MSLKYSRTTADYLIWSDAMNLIRKLANDNNHVISLLVAIGCFTGLRISDILSLRWFEILDKDEICITEKKTGNKKGFLWLRNNGSTLVSQFINTVIFSFGAFWNLHEFKTLIAITISSYVIYIFTSLADTPFLYIARKIIEKDSGKSDLN